MDNLYQKLKALIKEYEIVNLITHPSPDPDAIGSLLSMGQLIKQINKNARINYYAFDQPSFLTYFLKDFSEISYVSQEELSNLIKKEDLSIILDIGDPKRIDVLNSKKDLKLINIDHHQNSGKGFEDRLLLNICQHSRSTTTILFKIARNLKLEISPSFATYILLGIYGDSEHFNDLNMDKDMFRNIYELLGCQADINSIVLCLHRSESSSKLKSIAQALQKLIVTDKNYAFVTLSYKEIMQIKKATGYIPSKHDLLDRIRDIIDINFAIVIFEIEPGYLSSSIKTRTNVIDVSQIANEFGGGGHKIAAAFRYKFKGSFEKQIVTILKFIDSFIISQTQ